MMKLLSILAVSLVFLTAMIGRNTSQLAVTSPNPEFTARPTIVETKEIVTSHSQPSATLRPRDTATPSPSVTQSSTPTSTPIPTTTATITSTATPSRVMPGYYDAGSCKKYRIGYYLDVDFCIDQVDVLLDYSMNYSISWMFHLTYTPRPSSNLIYFFPNTKDFYLIDNLGKKYNPIATQYHEPYVAVKEGKVMTAVISFSPAPTGARIFTLYDDEHGVLITVLLDHPIQLYGYLALNQLPFELKYQLKYWQAGTNEEGRGILTHLKITNCTISEMPNSSPQGTLINQLKISPITYDLYRYYEQDWSVREYLVISGLEGINPDVKPLFRVTIPYDDAQNCILDASEVLANLQPGITANP
jgi:hypothetical protein